MRLTASPELGALLAEKFFPEVLAAHPELELGVELGYSFEDLLDPRFDLALRLGSVHDDRLVAHRLGAFSRIVVASPAYLKMHPVRQVEDLEQCNCLAFSGTELQAAWTLQKDSAIREVQVRGNFAVHGFTALLRAACAGLGVARVPAFVAMEPIDRSALVRVLPGWSAPATEVFLVHRFGHDRIRRVKVLIEAAQASVGALLKVEKPAPA